MMFEKLETQGVVDTCLEGEVRYRTQEGWRVVGVMQTVELDRAGRSCTPLRFVIQRDESSALADLSAELSDARQALARAVNETEQCHRERTHFLEQIETAQAQVEEERLACQRLQDDLKVVRAQRSAMETDIGKIRKHFGAKALEEALARA